MHMKKIRIIIIILLILNIAVTVLLMMLSNSPENTNKYEEAQEYLDERIIPRNLYELLSKCTGNVDKEEIYKKLNMFVIYIPELQKDVKDFSENELKVYFKNNSNIIIEKTGIDNFEEFLKLKKYIATNNVYESEFSYASIVKNTVVNEDDKTRLHVELVYKDKKTINIEVQVNNNNNSIKIIPV